MKKIMRRRENPLNELIIFISGIIAGASLIMGKDIKETLAEENVSPGNCKDAPENEQGKKENKER